jgi:hypothetical protein
MVRKGFKKDWIGKKVRQMAQSQALSDLKFRAEQGDIECQLSYATKRLTSDGLPL